MPSEVGVSGLWLRGHEPFSPSHLGSEVLRLGVGAHGWVVRFGQPSVRSPSWSWLQRCIQSASLRPGTHSFLFWTQRILNEGSYWTQKKNRMFMQITNSRKKQRHTIRKFVFCENNFYQLIDSLVTVYFAVKFQTKAEKLLCFLITLLSR